MRGTKAPGEWSSPKPGGGSSIHDWRCVDSEGAPGDVRARQSGAVSRPCRADGVRETESQGCALGFDVAPRWGFVGAMRWWRVVHGKVAVAQGNVRAQVDFLPSKYQQLTSFRRP